MSSASEPRPAGAAERRRFAILSPNFFPRTCGVGDHSARLGQELVRRGHEVSFFSRSPAEPNPIAPGLPTFGAAGDSPDSVRRGLTREVLAFRPTDVLLQYTPQMWETWRFGSLALPRLAAELRRAGVRVTLIAHELYVPYLSRPDLLLAAIAQRAMLAALLRSCDHAFVTTETRIAGMAPYARMAGGPAPGVLRVGPNAMPVTVERAASGPRIGVFSTAAIGKRYDVVLSAFAEIAQAFPAAELVIIGDLGAPDSRSVRAVTEIIRRHPAGERIKLTGKLDLADVARVIAGLDLYFFPANTGANTRSGTLPAALGSGLPVIAFDGSETDHSMFRDGENIALVSRLDGHAFAEVALRLLRNPEEAVRIGAGARELYQRHLTWERIADHLLESVGAPISPGARSPSPAP